VHNKKSNLGLIFEYTIQELVESIILKKDDKKKNLLKIIRKYFFENKYLSEEFSLVSSFLNADYKDKELAKKFIIEALKDVEKLKSTITERKKAKQNLLSDIYKIVDKESFFNHVIENYNTYSTINLIVDYYTENRKLSEISTVVELENKLLEHITNNKIKLLNKDYYEKTILENISKEEIPLSEYDNILALINFKQTFLNKLTPIQKEIVEHYIVTGTKDIFINKLNKHFKTNYNILRANYNNEKNQTTKNSLKEALNLFYKKYTESGVVEDKMKIVLDSFSLIDHEESNGISSDK